MLSHNNHIKKPAKPNKSFVGVPDVSRAVFQKRPLAAGDILISFTFNILQRKRKKINLEFEE
jgi:hypothetical protein